MFEGVCLYPHRVGVHSKSQQQQPGSKGSGLMNAVSLPDQSVAAPGCLTHRASATASMHACCTAVSLTAWRGGSRVCFGIALCWHWCCCSLCVCVGAFAFWCFRCDSQSWLALPPPPGSFECLSVGALCVKDSASFWLVLCCLVCARACWCGEQFCTSTP